MNPHRSRERNQAMTLIEVAVLIVVIGILAAMLLPAVPSKHKYGSPISCTSNLKQVVVTEMIWAGDHHDKYPMNVSVANGGAMEFMNTDDAWRAFQVMSNELSTPMVLHCWSDSQRTTHATNWGDDLKNKISYFIGLDATEKNPASLSCGDGNFLLNNSPANHGFVNAATNATLSWDLSRHVSEVKDGILFKTRAGAGNLGFSDGSVRTLRNSDLPVYLQQTGLATNRLFIP